MSRSTTFGTLILLACFPAVGNASETQRLWHSSSGSHSVKAEFVARNGDTVTLLKASGATITVTLDALSAADREYLKQVDKAKQAGESNSSTAKNRPNSGRAPVELVGRWLVNGDDDASSEIGSSEFVIADKFIILPIGAFPVEWKKEHEGNTRVDLLVGDSRLPAIVRLINNELRFASPMAPGEGYPKGFDANPPQAGIQLSCRKFEEKSSDPVMPDHPNRPKIRFDTAAECCEHFLKLQSDPGAQFNLYWLRPDRRFRFVGFLYIGVIANSGPVGSGRADEAKTLLKKYPVKNAPAGNDLPRISPAEMSQRSLEVGQSIPRVFEFLEEMKGPKSDRPKSSIDERIPEFKIIEDGDFAVAVFTSSNKPSIPLVRMNGNWYVTMMM